MKFIHPFALLVGLSVSCVAMAHGTHATHAAPAPSQPAATQQPTTWIPAPQKKGGSGVSVRWRLAATPKVGQAVHLTIEFGGLRAADGARVELKGENVALASASSGVQRLKAGAPQRQQLSFTPPTDGVYFITVVTEQFGRVSTVSLPVRVGKAEVKLQKPEAITTLPSGEKAIIMQSK